MRRDPAYRPITAAEFLDINFGTDRKFELDNGVIYMMTGGTEQHSLAQGNIFSWLRVRLRGTGCRPHGSDMAVQIDDTNVRYPDISIYCDLPPLDEAHPRLALNHPIAIIEVLSPSTTTFDQGTKLDEYRGIGSIRTIAFVDPVNELCRTIERSGSNGWLDQMFSGRSGIAIPALDLVIPHDEIFARD